jgi:hypothetical protein
MAVYGRDMWEGQERVISYIVDGSVLYEKMIKSKILGWPDNFRTKFRENQ